MARHCPSFCFFLPRRDKKATLRVRVHVIGIVTYGQISPDAFPQQQQVSRRRYGFVEGLVLMKFPPQLYLTLPLDFLSHTLQPCSAVADVKLPLSNSSNSMMRLKVPWETRAVFRSRGDCAKSTSTTCHPLKCKPSPTFTATAAATARTITKKMLFQPPLQRKSAQAIMPTASAKAYNSRPQGRNRCGELLQSLADEDGDVMHRLVA